MKRNGFTLVELMIGVALVGIIVGAIVVTISSLSKSFQKSTASAVRNEAIITAMNVMERQVERSYYVQKISNSEIVLKVKPTESENPPGSASSDIEKPYLMYFQQRTSNSNELIGYCIGETVGKTPITPTSGSAEVIYDKLSGSGSVKFVVLTTNQFYLPETVIFPGQTKTFQFYDEYTNTYNVTTQTYNIPGIVIGNLMSGSVDTKFSINLSTLGATDGLAGMSISYLSRDTGVAPTYEPIFTTQRSEIYSNKVLTTGVTTNINETNMIKITSDSLPSSITDGSLVVAIKNASSVSQIKVGTNSYIELPYIMTAGKSVIVTLSGKEQSADKNRGVELSNTLTAFDQ